MSDKNNDDVRQGVRDRYASVARGEGTACCAPSCCGSQPAAMKDESARLGYSAEEMDSVPEGANLGLGCGNPQAIANLKEGETVLDLGSGAGFDCFLAAKQVGEKGSVIGVDMTPDMISKARKNAADGGYSNVEFRLGEIEHIPAADNSVDVIMSNCVINLSPDKAQVYADAYRVLQSGGRLAISDVVATGAMPEEVRNDLDKHAGCVSGAALVTDIESMLKSAGFTDIKIDTDEQSREFIKNWFPDSGVEDFVVSATIEAVK